MKSRMSLSKKECLLIISDDDQVGRLIKRLFERNAKTDFAEILTAINAEQADNICKLKAVTAIISDYELGKNQPTGPCLIKELRSKYKSIRAAYIYTGAPGGEDSFPGIDAILLKTGSGSHKLVEAVVSTLEERK